MAGFRYKFGEGTALSIDVQEDEEFFTIKFKKKLMDHDPPFFGCWMVLERVKNNVFVVRPMNSYDEKD